MNLKIGTHVATGSRFLYATRTDFGRKRYTADCSARCIGPDALKPAYWPTLGEARKGAIERGTLEPTPAHAVLTK